MRARLRGSHQDDLVPVRPCAQLAVRVGLWSLVAVGFVGGVAGLLRPAPSPRTASVQRSADEVAGPDVAGFAELAVGQWLEARPEDAERVAALFLQDAVNPASGATTTEVQRLATVRVRTVDDGYWAVTVAAGVVERDRDGVAFPPTTWYVEVGVARGDGGRLAAAGTPAVVAGPRPTSAGLRVAGPALRVPERDDPVAVTVQGFLAGLLAGGGDVARYVAPGVDLAAPDPAPFVEVELQRLGLVEQPAGGLQVRAGVTATTVAGGQRSLGYQLELTERAGRWEITSVSGAPSLEPTDHDPASSTTVHPPPGPSSTSIAGTPGA
jgi:Conjugative transposon protein TcpC